jgi:hypothetical protein
VKWQNITGRAYKILFKESKLKTIHLGGEKQKFKSKRKKCLSVKFMEHSKEKRSAIGRTKLVKVAAGGEWFHQIFEKTKQKSKKTIR